MLRFFRKIRQSLLESGKMRTYFWYAIGEVLLVMIGILLALQINNWNEYRKDRIIEKKILEEIWIDMAINRRDLENSVQRTEKHLQEIVELNDHLIKQQPLYDSLAIDLRGASSTEQFTPRVTGYESLKAKGVDMIEDISLRNHIIQMYGLWYQELVNEGREFEQFDNPTIDLLPYLKKHLIVNTNMSNTLVAEDIGYSFESYGLAVKDYDALLNDSEFILMLQKSMFNRANKIAIAKRLVLRMEELEEIIDLELKEM